ncbi:MAG TPA: hypothetical protein VKM55_30665 [Candidatus Lokiarchaeia archaeon]|nr:hypothetical protein [Candidatus Lokiarchaeia archaeon]
MKRGSPLEPRSLFWLFKKRLFFETRKYTAGIILTAGITALFISMLVVGSSFLSAAYRATGTKGPRIFDIKCPASSINITLEMPRSMNITCGVSDYYQIETVHLYVSTDFMKSSIPLNGTRFDTNLSGQYYRFTIDFGQFPQPITYLFFFWANNSAGYFSYENNNGNFYSIRLMTIGEINPINPQDPAMLKVIQRVQIGIDNLTTTRNHRPDFKVWLNDTSPAWINAGNYTYPIRTGARFYDFLLDQDLSMGSNNITIFVQQKRLSIKSFLVTRINTPLNITKSTPGNRSTIFNHLSAMSFSTNDWITCNISLSGPSNNTWLITSYNKSFDLAWKFNNTFGNYSLAISGTDYYGNSLSCYINFSFSKSPSPYITIVSPKRSITLPNMTITIVANFSEVCNITIRNTNQSVSLLSFVNVTSGGFPGITLIRGWNYINMSATNAAGKTNSTLLKIQQQPYVIRSIYYDVFALPGGKLNININFTTNYTASGVVSYSFDYSNLYHNVSFSLQNSSLYNGIQQGILHVAISVPKTTSNVLFNFTLFFGPEKKHFDQNGYDYHVPVQYLYADTTAPVPNSILIGPSTNVYSTSISSNDKVSVLVNFYDVTGVKNATVIYAVNSSAFHGNVSVNMVNISGSTNGVGNWNAVLPSHGNSSTIFIKIVVYDVLNNSQAYSTQYTVHDILNTNLVNVIPGLLDPMYKQAITGAISTLLVIMVLIIVVFLAIFISINDQNVKREIYREEDRIFILKHVCKLDYASIKKYYYIEQLVQDCIGYGAGTLLGFFLLGPVFVGILKITLVAWTFDFQRLFYFSFTTLESWVGLLLLLFILCALLIKLIQVDNHVAKMAH